MTYDWYQRELEELKAKLAHARIKAMEEVADRFHELKEQYDDPDNPFANWSWIKGEAIVRNLIAKEKQK